MFPRLPARATFVADTNFVSGTQKMSFRLPGPIVKIIFLQNVCPDELLSLITMFYKVKIETEKQTVVFASRYVQGHSLAHTTFLILN